MIEKLDLSQGYTGDSVEEFFKRFTSEHMPYWWFFREVLRPTDGGVEPFRVLRTDGNDLSDGEKREFVAIGLLNYAVYRNMADAVSHFNDMCAFLDEWGIHNPSIYWPIRSWKACYSSLYSSFNGMANVVCIIYGHKSPFGDNPQHRIWNYTPTDAVKLTRGRGFNDVCQLLEACQARLEIRDHLDHYWPIWKKIGRNEFFIDRGFSKGYVVTDVGNAILDVDAIELAEKHVLNTAHDFNEIYKNLSLPGGVLDDYLLARNWSIDYSDYEIHNRQRPVARVIASNVAQRASKVPHVAAMRRWASWSQVADAPSSASAKK